jgi:HAD superfamily hydrolase (TIGR01490 family)
VYRCYRGFRPEELRDWAWRFQSRHGLSRTHLRSLDLLRRHSALGHRIVFVTGSLRELIEPLARRLEPVLGEGVAIRVEAVSLSIENGRFTGELCQNPLSGSEKAARVRQVAAEEQLDLEACHAYGDSIADRELLEAVGRPAAVNPCSRLHRLALERGWPVLRTEQGARA